VLSASVALPIWIGEKSRERAASSAVGQFAAGSGWRIAGVGCHMGRNRLARWRARPTHPRRTPPPSRRRYHARLAPGRWMAAWTSRTTQALAPGLAVRFRAVRAASEALAEPLSPEDCALQSMESCSPVKWHLAHTSWFFETFLLAEHVPDYVPPRPEYRVLFN